MSDADVPTVCADSTVDHLSVCLQQCLQHDSDVAWHGAATCTVHRWSEPELLETGALHYECLNGCHAFVIVMLPDAVGIH